MSDVDESVSAMETPVAPESGDEEHAVIAHFRLASGDVGEVDGNEFGEGEAVVYAYGPDADALFKVMEPTLRGLPFRPAHIVLRRGDSESRLDL
ncbi:hypothetical protein ACFVP3_16900 [Streptomyces sp. NPDC057806]|uniref:hypothetical protein n=1 Tax=Streptomyces sp. NPDC057806 TaxID=3346255 RepID=UPI0036ADC73B